MTGSNNTAEAQSLIRDRDNVQALGLDVGNAEALSRAVSDSDVVVRCEDVLAEASRSL